ncbi:MAG: ribonuclease P protein component [Rubrimonas sp.]
MGDLAAGPATGGASELKTMKRRREFLAASRALRASAPSLNLQARPRAAGEGECGVRVGYTCSKKIGNAVARNRAKRRLRAAAAQVLPGQGRPGWDYVLIGKAEATAARPFALMLADLAAALSRVHEPVRRRRPEAAPPDQP